MLKVLVACLLALMGPAAWAQSKATNPWVLYAGAQANYLTAGENAVLFRARVERNFTADYNNLAGDQLQRAQVQLGYEWRLGQRWTGGAVEKLAFDPNASRTFYSGLFLRHNGHIGSIQFRKRAVFEYVARNQDQPNGAQLRVRFDFDRSFTAGKLGLRPRLAYDFQFDYDLTRRGPDEPKPETRLIDHGYLRLELGLELSPRLTLVPYLARQTDFVVATEQTDADGNVKVPKGPRNLRTPSVGLDIRYTFTNRLPNATRDLSTFEGYQD